MGIIYSITINQLAVVENGWNLDCADMAIFQCFHIFGSSPQTRRAQGPEGSWFWLTCKKITEELPILGITSEKQLKRRIAKLIDCGLIDKCPTPNFRDYYRFGRNYDKLLSKDMDKNVHDMEKSSEAWTKMSTDMDKNVQKGWTKMSTEDYTSNNIILNKDYTINPLNPPKGGYSPKPKTNYKKLVDDFLPSIPNPDWQDLIREFLYYKIDIKQPLKTPKSVQLFFKRLVKDSRDNIETARDYCEAAMANGWHSYHPDAGKSFYQQKADAKKAENAEREAKMLQDLEEKRQKEEEFRQQMAAKEAERQRKIEEFRRRQAEEEAKQAEAKRKAEEAFRKFANGETDELPF